LISDFNYDLPFKDNTFDIAICYSVLSYVKNYKSFLKEIKRILKKDEYLICVIPHENWDQKMLNNALCDVEFKTIIYKYPKEWFYAFWYDKTSVYSYAICQNKK
ncbi:MAG TPA: class I SAM-dependent methyltransferase, partial [Verrucomicrobiae bacterium]|nr:class I SAM-dependent methyltransferase [Verrucomicrobiae bacterium]